jgi:glycosyltransferase involved in cell wall biosynthesis
MTRVAAVLVTSNSARWLEPTLTSVLEQEQQADEIVIVDDRSTDDTRAIIESVAGSRARVVPARATTTDLSTRIAANFLQGLQEIRHCDTAILGDHDDIWHPERLAHQAQALQVWSDVSMLASDGRLVDMFGNVVPGSLRSAFPVPRDFNDLPPSQQMRAVIRRSIATGGASAVRPEAFADVVIPAGWLHDRWWSLVATAREQMRLDDTAVIDYRISPGQEVGLDRGHQARSPLDRLRTGMGHLGTTTSRIRDLHTLATTATSETAPELRGARLLRNLL